MRLVFRLKSITYWAQEMPLLLVLFMAIYTIGIGTSPRAWAMPAVQLSSHGTVVRILWDMKRKCWISSKRAEDFRKEIDL